ncbi:MAG: ABC transporter permease [Sulfolobales archaeon]|nr:ABC transporter permease [Sulfolobales archaeon]MDW8082753.1 ABC transporter permease [Sulfolobales archaeon]
MKTFLIRRVFSSVITFIAIITVVFLLARMTGDPLAELENDPRISPATIAAIKASFGLDRPLYQQYLNYLFNLFRGDFGYSLHYKEPVASVITQRLPYTLALLIPSITLSNYLAYAAGIELGWRRGSKVDSILMSISMFIRSTPYFWLAIVFLYVFSVVLGVTPLFGALSPGRRFSWTLDSIIDYLWHYILPFTVLTLRGFLAELIYVRNVTVDILGEDFIVTGIAKGLPERYIKRRYVARNAMLPIVTVLGMRYAFIIDGAILTETVFSYPGTGRLVYQAIFNRDFWLLQGAVVIIAASVIVVNLAIDILYAYLDPRVRYR